ncbi:carbohydrate ABC transporter substrate-binding protein, partial [Clostridium saudiense]|nr:carbohydrate ABC transporter substrate-binding protein [Clostridium saudiense]
MRYLCKRFYIFLLIVLLVAVPVVGAKFFLKGINLGTNDEDELKGDITFLSNRTDKREEIEALIKEFEELHPKVNVELELIGDAENILQRKASVGELPDVTLVPFNISNNEYANYFLTIDDLGFNDNNI